MLNEPKEGVLSSLVQGSYRSADLHLTTIFTFTWVALHPNVLSPRHCGQMQLKQKVFMMFLGIMWLELVAIWAVKQLIRAAKGDFLAKLLAVLQTGWFILQCIARWVTHLPVTELEVVTHVIAFLNIFVYDLWWNKPQNMLYHVHLLPHPYPTIIRRDHWM
ncbi:hypothetical protein AN958_09291 [Leucoagaricus sp. SymC.cos]|nr:hypothetical protein AN958_09291 [Leucoagaricus sp. SymC.cos]